MQVPGKRVCQAICNTDRGQLHGRRARAMRFHKFAVNVGLVRRGRARPAAACTPCNSLAPVLGCWCYVCRQQEASLTEVSGSWAA